MAAAIRRTLETVNHDIAVLRDVISEWEAVVPPSRLKKPHMTQ